MDQAAHRKKADSGQRTARIRRFIHAEMRTPVETLKANAAIRSTQWESVKENELPVAGLPKGVDSLGKMATAGVIS